MVLVCSEGKHEQQQHLSHTVNNTRWDVGLTTGSPREHGKGITASIKNQHKTSLPEFIHSLPVMRGSTQTCLSKVHVQDHSLLHVFIASFPDIFLLFFKIYFLSFYALL